MKLEGLTQMYQNTKNIAATAAALALTGCSTVMYDITPYNHNISQWPGLSHVAKQDKGLADRLVKFNDVGPASRELTYACENEPKYKSMCDQLLKDGHVVEGVDGAVVIAYAIGTFAVLKATGVIKSGKGSGAAACRNIPGPSGPVC